MFLKITWTRHGDKKRKYGSIVETYRENGKIKHRHMKSLGYLEGEKEIQQAQKLVKKLKAGKTLIMLEDLNTKANLDYGIIYITNELWKRYGIADVLSEVGEKRKARFDIEQISFLLTANRLHNPSSDLCAYEWMKKDAYIGTTKVKLQYLYRTLDVLKDEKLFIEKSIFKSLKKHLDLKVDIAFYDLTSSYFQGHGPESAKHGYSRDKRRDKKQIVIGLVLVDGIPITHRIWPGNTTDKTTLKEAVKNLKKDFKIRNIIFVADRGLITVKNLNELNTEKYDYIIATARRRDKIAKEYMVKQIICPEDKTLSAKKVYTKKSNGKKKKDRYYMLCLDTETRKERIETLKNIRKRIEEELDKLKNSKSKDLNANVVKILGKNKRLFNYDTTKGLSYSLNRESWKYENNIAGKFMLVTTTDLSPEEAMKQYKELKEIERAFKELKSSIKLRPFNHSVDERVEGHTFVCVMGLLMRRLIERNSDITTDNVLREMKRLRVNEEVIEGETVFRRNELSKEQKKILKTMGIEEPLKIILS